VEIAELIGRLVELIARACTGAGIVCHRSGFNHLNLEALIGDATIAELKKRGHDTEKVRPFSINGCATAVLIDPASGNRIAGADRRRDCYAMAY
jgi:gamma-glutamyltranspeptidase